MIFLVKVIVLFSAASIIYSSIVALNKMSHKSNHIIRLAHILMSGGSVYEIFYIMQSHTPNFTELLLFLGCALLLIYDNRRAYHCPMMDKKNEYFNRT